MGHEGVQVHQNKTIAHAIDNYLRKHLRKIKQANVENFEQINCLNKNLIVITDTSARV